MNSKIHFLPALSALFACAITARDGSVGVLFSIRNIPYLLDMIATMAVPPPFRSPKLLQNRSTVAMVTVSPASDLQLITR